jgi:hypothetical protein
MAIHGVIPIGTDQALLIGQKFSAEISLDPGSPTSANDTYAWTVSGGDPFADYSMPPPSGPGVYTPFSSPNSATMACYFAHPQSGITVTCSVGLPLAGINLNLSKNNIASVAPDYALQVIQGTPQMVLDGTIPGLWWIRLFGAEFESHGKAGIYFHAGKVDTPPPWSSGGTGEWCFVQLVTDSVSWYKRNDGVFFDWSANFSPPTAPKLDGKLPYDEATYAADGILHWTRDTPGFSADSTVVQCSDNGSYVMYEMYRPPGADSRFVPLRSVTWHWSGHFGRNSNILPWFQMEPPQATFTPYDFSSHPVWTSVYPETGGSWIQR